MNEATATSKIMFSDSPAQQDIAPLDAFLSRWHDADGSERANYQLFVGELCALLDMPTPQPATGQPEQDGYVFERRVLFRHGDGSESVGFIDLYRRGAFVLEAKKVRQGVAVKGFDAALLRARSQGERYARALPVSEGRPPFVVVVDVGRVIELYADFTCSGATYTPFPDPRSHRIHLENLRDPAVRERLRAVWLEPLSLDPTRRSARVTFEIAQHLAKLARQGFIVITLERDRALGHEIADPLDHRCRVGAITDQVAQKGDAPDGLLLRVAKTGIERLDVGVNVRQQCDSHAAQFRIGSRTNGARPSPGPAGTCLSTSWPPRWWSPRCRAFRPTCRCHRPSSA